MHSQNHLDWDAACLRLNEPRICLAFTIQSSYAGLSCDCDVNTYIKMYFCAYSEAEFLFDLAAIYEMYIYFCS